VRLLLLFMLSMVVLGLLTPRLTRFVYAAVFGAAVFTTALYFTLDRFMT
jgi:hypothetical protein